MQVLLHRTESKKMFRLTLFASSVLIFFSLAATAFGATRLPADEVEALSAIGKTLGKKDWNFGADPCGGEYGWDISGSENAVTCNCTFSNNTVSHVVSIVLKTQSLPGSLPPELIRIPYLQEIDLSRNYLNGSIPPEWGSSNLVNIDVSFNKLSGQVPSTFTIKHRYVSNGKSTYGSYSTLDVEQKKGS